MKRVINFLLIIVLMLSCILFISPKNVKADSLDDPVSLFALTNYVGEDIEFKCFVARPNTGIFVIRVSVDYDQTVFELTDCITDDRECLTDFEIEKRGVSTSNQNGLFSILFVCPSYRASDRVNRNDTSSGLLFTLKFKVLPTAQSGTYNIKLNTTKDFGDGSLFDDNLSTRAESQAVYASFEDVPVNKTLITGYAKVVVENHVVVDAQDIEGEEPTDPNKILGFVIPVAVIGGSALIVFVISRIVKNRKRHKDKIKSGKWVKL